jgi:hypothetical protein
MNPDIRNRFITYVTFTENDDPYIPKEGINVYLIRFVHQDPEVDGREGRTCRTYIATLLLLVTIPTVQFRYGTCRHAMHRNGL